MAITIEVFTIGNGDLIQEVFNAIAAVFNNSAGIGAVTSLAVLLGGLFAVFEFSKSRDIAVLIKWVGMYVLVTTLILYPKATIVIEDRTGIDEKPRIVDHVPLSLAVFAGFTSRIGIGLTEMVETVFHLPEDMSYNKTGMLMGSRLVLASKNFQITDASFSQTLNEFMQQCVFFDLLLKKYTVDDLLHTENPWEFIKAHTSVARAFPLNDEITICNVGADKLDKIWKGILANAASVYGGQILGTSKKSGEILLSHLQDSYNFLTNVSVQGETILRTNLLANALDQALSHYGANANAPAALQAYEDTKAALQARDTMDQTGRQAGIWMQYFKNIIEAVLYASFLLIYFLSYFPFGAAIIRNYLYGLFVLQALAPMYAIINFAANFLAQNRSNAFLATDPTHSGLSIANIAGVTQANADAMAVAGYLMWPVTLGGAIMLFRGLPSAIQSMGQLLGGVVQHAGSHVAAESIGGNISAGNASFGNRSLFNTNANHWDTNVRFAAGGATFQTKTGSTLSITPGGMEVLDARGAMSNLPVSIQAAESLRTAASHQMQSSINAGLTKQHAASLQYSNAIREVDDYAHQHSNFTSSGKSHSSTDTSAFNQSAHTVSQLVHSWAKEHNVSHERAAQLFGQVYADIKTGGGFILKGEVGASANASTSARASFGSLYNDARRYAVDNNFVESVDSAKRAAIEEQYRENVDQGNRTAHSVARSFDSGDHYRQEASSQFSKAESYASLASYSQENAQSINANYTQAFFEWLKTQPSPSSLYGQGNLSNSAIDNMASHDLPQLQSYADQYVRETTNNTIKGFEKQHHLQAGDRVLENTFNKNNHLVDEYSKTLRQSESQNPHVQKIENEITKKYEARGKVDTHTRDNVSKKMDDYKHRLSNKQGNLTSNSNHLEGEVHKKVKGQIIGSIASDESLGKLITETNKKTKPLFPFIHKDKKDE